MSVISLPGPIREPARVERIPDSCAMVIFGATGDLTRRKLMPALYRLMQEHLLPPGFSVIGNSRIPMSAEEFRSLMKASVEKFGGRVDSELWQQFAAGLFYLAGSADDSDMYRQLRALLDGLDRQRGTGGNRLIYLAVPPDVVLGIVRQLQAAGLSQSERGWARIIIEKPFGYDLASARTLNEELDKVFREDQIYRIDHYLGKETVQNLLVFRFANGIFEPIWNRRYIEEVQITAAETLGVADRAVYYDGAGALRDMVQNHLLQLLTLTAMEPPVAFDSEPVRNEKVKVLLAVKPVPTEQVNRWVVRGQYGPGRVDGRNVAGYREEPGIPPDSVTETYVAWKLHIQNWRWAGVPFCLRAGKRMPEHQTQVVIQFKQPPLRMFGETSFDRSAPNLLTLRIQPDEGVSLKFAAKVPGPGTHVHPMSMDSHYTTTFGMASANAYERLLLDCMLGDATLFARREEVELAWQLVTPILESWKQQPPPSFPNYPAGTWGPPEADSLPEAGHRWRAA